MKKILNILCVVGLLFFGVSHYLDWSVAGDIEVAGDEGLVFPDEPPAEPDDYRMDRYRSIVPVTLKDAIVVEDNQAKQLYEQGAAVFIDVMPHVPKPPNLPKGTIWREKKRMNIPGSIWLANVGYGRLPSEMDAFFRSQLTIAAKGSTETPLLFYCQKECWMSWNAAKRALEYGYRKVYWYPLGTDGWLKIGQKVGIAVPVPLPQMTRALEKTAAPKK